MIRYTKKMMLNTSLGQSLALYNYLRQGNAMRQELAQLPVKKSGCEVINGEELPFLILQDGTSLHGIFPTEFEREIFHKWKNNINSNITEDAVRVAMDVVLRYRYPHAMPQVTMPYSRRARKCFHPQHRETIRDMPGLSNEMKAHLLDVFKIKRGECFLDVGAYMGFGVVRMAKELGRESRIMAVEADSKALFLLKLNVDANNLSNVTIVPMAVSNQDGVAKFFKTERQANSIISGVVGSGDNILNIPTVTIDSLLKEASVESLDRISITINGAEVEAIDGMKTTLEKSKGLRLSIAGWYKRGRHRVGDIISAVLTGDGYNVAIGHEGGLLAWK